MPYSQYRVKDRQAIGQIKYQIRRFYRQMKTAEVSEADQMAIQTLFNRAFQHAAGSNDFDDDGTLLPQELPDE